MAQRQLRLCGVLLIVVACTQPAPRGRPAGPEDKAALLKEATEQYKLDDERGAIDDDNAPIEHRGAVSGLQVSAFRMKKKWFHGSDHDWVAAIKSNKRYERLNLGVGMNYIFRLPAEDMRHELVVVPEDRGLQPRYLTYNRYLDLTGGHRGPPQVIRAKSRLQVDEFVIGGCIECSIGHCSTLDAGDPYQ